MRAPMIAAYIVLTASGFFKVNAQETHSVSINMGCKTGQAFLTASTYYVDPFCSHWATAPSGGCTQWKLFFNGQLTVSKYTVPASSNSQFPTTPLDYYNLGRFAISQPGLYQLAMSYSRIVCSGWWICKTCNTQLYVDQTPTVSVTANDLAPASWLTKCPIGSFDNANCFVMAKPAGGFIWDRSFYVTPAKSCSLGTFDGLACHVMNKPALGFIWDMVSTCQPVLAEAARSELSIHAIALSLRHHPGRSRFKSTTSSM
jgi:hypothetical protein